MPAGALTSWSSIDPTSAPDQTRDALHGLASEPGTEIYGLHRHGSPVLADQPGHSKHAGRVHDPVVPHWPLIFCMRVFWRWKARTAVSALSGLGMGSVKKDNSRRRLDEVRGSSTICTGITCTQSASIALAKARGCQGTGLGDQARGQAGGSAVEQRSQGRVGQLCRWVPRQAGARPDIPVAMDWTDFNRDGRAMLVLSLVGGHGRAGPLVWLTVWKEELADRRNDYEEAYLRRLAETAPVACRVTILADCGFGDQKLFASLGTLGFGWRNQARGRLGGPWRPRPQTAPCPYCG